MDAKPASTGEDGVDGRHSDTDLERLEMEIEALRAQLADVQKILDRLARLLEGNGGAGILDKFALTIESMGRLFENAHREGQLKGDALEALIPKIKTDDAWFNVALLQSFAIANLTARE
jgi:hypothetical protein